jgi:uncharacterized heparinase superfamily protein
LYYTVRNKIKKRKAILPKEMIMPNSLSTYYSVDVENEQAVLTAEKICDGLIPIVSDRMVEFSGDWDLKGEEYRLVSFKLNSFRWLLFLSDAYKSTGNEKYIEKGFEFIKDWHKQCGALIIGDKWNAYVIAERITNWIGFVSEYGNDSRKQEIASWIYPQAKELKDSMEYQLGANHLLSEAKALVYAGFFLKDESLYRLGKSILFDECHEQFLQDGGHYEQSISYHVESLQQYFECYAVLKIQDDEDAEKLALCMEAPYRFLNGMIGVNGKIPLFNDSAYDYPFYDASDFLSTAEYIYETTPPNGKKGDYSRRWSWLKNRKLKIEWDSSIRYENTGFINYPFMVRGKSYSFFMDCGNNGPDYNLGHAHADALSILLYSEDKEILVDSGVFTYMPSEDRNSCRSTKAHNTVEVDGKNSAEVWAAFRVAKRGHTKLIEYSCNDGLRIKASHDGYAKCLADPVVHIREVKIKDKQIVVNDNLEYKDNHTAISRFHISSQCTVVQNDSKTCIIDGNIKVESDGDIRITNCKIARMFGITEIAKCIEINFSGANSLKTVFTIG